jgi:16S rRNA (adenine1518-N6/adenine1519-N6)-dimethyltransferase
VRSPSPPDTAALLKAYGFRPRRQLGQNFLNDSAALERITVEARIGENDAVLEVGCGLGNLTRYLCTLARLVVAVEIDERLVAIARDVLSLSTNVRLVCGDILALTPAELDLPQDYIVAANIPYYVTSPIMRHLLESRPRPRRMVLTVQREVAQRICARPPDMSLLALSMQVYGSAEIVAEIPATAFIPPPKVDSAVVRVETYGEPLIPGPLLATFFHLAKAGFGRKRKMLHNALASGLRMSPSESTRLLRQSNIDPHRRAETLEIPEWENLCHSYQTSRPRPEPEFVARLPATRPRYPRR